MNTEDARMNLKKMLGVAAVAVFVVLALLWQIWLKAACEQHLTVRAS